jgi:TonB family protein
MESSDRLFRFTSRSRDSFEQLVFFIVLYAYDIEIPPDRGSGFLFQEDCMRTWMIAWLFFVGVVSAGMAWGGAPMLLCGAGESGDEFVAVDVMPEMIYQATAEYPAEAKAKGIEGKVTISLRVQIDGTVSGPKVIASSGSNLLDQSALAAAGKYRFKPALQDGKPVAVWVSFVVNFVLDSEKKQVPPTDTFIAVDIAPEIVKQVDPTYPAEAKANKIQGKVYIRLFVDSSGKVEKAEVAESSGSKLLDDSALDAARKFLFKPAIKEKRPVGVWVTLPISFIID